MSSEAPIYDLILLLDLSATDEVRAKVVADTRAAIEAGGTLIGHHEWGQRALAYPIERHQSAEYHLFQMYPSNELLESLNRALHISDGVLRHRIIKLAPGTPPPAEGRPAVVAPATETPVAEAPLSEAPPAAPVAEAAEDAEPAEPAAEAPPEAVAEPAPVS